MAQRFATSGDVLADGPTVDRDDRAEIIDRLYEVAIDPVRFEELMDVWEGRIGPLRLRVNGTQTISDAEIENHAERASVFLDRFELTSRLTGYQAALEDVGRNAAFVCDPSTGILAANSAAWKVFAIFDGAAFSALPFDEDDLRQLIEMARRVVSGRLEKAATLRMRTVPDDQVVLMRVMPVRSEMQRPLAIVVSTALAWPDGFDQTIQDAFGLTVAETEVVRAITEGKAARDIAVERGRSMETVRTQIRSILAKTETHSQAELIRITIALMDVVAATDTTPQMAPPPKGPLRPIPFQTLTMPDGRRFDYIEFGDPNGRACLYLPMKYGIIRWPADVEALAASRKIRVIVPIRAGYGYSAHHPAGTHHLRETAEDLARLLAACGVTRTAVLTLGGDIRYAAQLSIIRPDLVSGILACSATLPLTAASQYERMDKWQRFILANARYTPSLLPFLVKAGFSLARRIGKAQFFQSVNSGSPADLRTFNDPLVREAMLLGSEICLGATHSAHQAFATECIDSERDWSQVALDCPAPIIMLQGGQDPQSPETTIRELLPRYPRFKVEFFPDAGQLLFFKERRYVLDRLEEFLPGK